MEVPKVSVSVLRGGEALLVLHFLFLRQLVSIWWSWQTLKCPNNSSVSLVVFTFQSFWGLVSRGWIFVYCVGKMEKKCSKSPVSSRLITKRFYPVFEDKFKPPESFLGRLDCPVLSSIWNRKRRRLIWLTHCLRHSSVISLFQSSLCFDVLLVVVYSFALVVLFLCLVYLFNMVSPR